MTTKQLSATEKVSISRMNEIVKDLGLQSPADWTWDISPAKRGRRMFTKAGIAKIQNRCKKRGRRGED
jgi:hypothetical protein